MCSTCVRISRLILRCPDKSARLLHRQGMSHAEHRRIVVATALKDHDALAVQFAVESVRRTERDVIDLVHVVCAREEPQEVFHSARQTLASDLLCSRRFVLPSAWSQAFSVSAPCARSAQGLTPETAWQKRV